MVQPKVRYGRYGLRRACGPAAYGSVLFCEEMGWMRIVERDDTNFFGQPSSNQIFGGNRSYIIFLQAAGGARPKHTSNTTPGYPSRSPQPGERREHPNQLTPRQP